MNDNLWASLLDVEQAFDVVDPQAALYLVTMILVFYISKKVHDWVTPYNLNEQLTGTDNKAVALSFAGYIIGVGIILSGVLSGESMITPSDSPKRDLYFDLLNTLVWCIVGIVLLQIGRWVNDKCLLLKFDNIKELVTDRNIGTGAVEFGSLVGSALIVRAALTGDEEVHFLVAVGLAFLYLVVGQISFILFGFLYQFISRFHLHEEIEKDNVSAGVSFGLSLIAIGILISGYVVKFDSLVGLALWFVIGAFSLVACRYLVDKWILPGNLLDEEISVDHNWGAALIEGGVAIGVALLCITLI